MPLDKVNVIRDPARIPGLSISIVSKVLNGKAYRYRISAKNTERSMNVAREYHLYQVLFSVIAGSKNITVIQKLSINR